jgi:vitamin B12 transporter
MRLFRQCISIGFLVVPAAWALSTYTVTGFVLDRQTGNPVPDANIILSGTPMGTVSLDHGQYTLRSIPGGEYELKVDVVGFAAETKRCTVDRNMRLDFRLESSPVRFNPVVVTATRSRHLRSAVTACTDVISRDAWGGQSDGTAGEILNASGNVLVKDNGGFSGLRTLSIRGSSSAQVLVLLDGLRLNTASSGGVDLNTIPSDALERIEIVRGGHSALLGSDAMGGAVHLITRNPENTNKASFGIGHTVASFGTRIYDAYGSFGPEWLRSFMLVNRIRSRGDFLYQIPGEFQERKRENNDVMADALFFKSRLDAAALGQFQFGLQAFKSDRGTADPVPSAPSFGRRSETRRFWNLDWWKTISSALVFSARGGVQTDENRYRSLYEDDVHDYGSTAAEGHLQWAVLPSILFQSGLEWSDDRLNSTKFLRQRRITRSLYAELEASGRISVRGREMELKVNPAVRWDRFGDGGVETCPKIGMLLRAGRAVALAFRANAGRSFRMPTFNDLFWPEQIWPGFGGTRGNASLKPETGWYGDAGLVFEKTEPWYLQAEGTFFQNRMENLIDWRSDADLVFAPVNVGRSRVTGFESRITFRTPDNRFQAWISPCWMRAVDLSAAGQDSPLPYRPEWKVDADASFRMSPLRFGVRYQALGRRFTMPGNPSALPAYSLWHASVSFGKKLGVLGIETSLHVNNIQNRFVSTLQGYPLPGREFRFCVELHY